MFSPDQFCPTCGGLRPERLGISPSDTLGQTLLISGQEFTICQGHAPNPNRQQRRGQKQPGGREGALFKRGFTRSRTW